MLTIPADIKEMSEDEAKELLLNHPLPKARQRTDIVSDDDSSEHMLLGAMVSLELLLGFPLRVLPSRPS